MPQPQEATAVYAQQIRDWTGGWGPNLGFDRQIHSATASTQGAKAQPGRSGEVGQ